MVKYHNIEYIIMVQIFYLEYKFNPKKVDLPFLFFCRKLKKLKLL